MEMTLHQPLASHVREIKSDVILPWPRGSVGWKVIWYTKKVAGSILSWGAYGRQLIDVSLSHSSLSLSSLPHPSPPLHLSLKSVNVSVYWRKVLNWDEADKPILPEEYGSWLLSSIFSLPVALHSLCPAAQSIMENTVIIQATGYWAEAMSQASPTPTLGVLWRVAFRSWINQGWRSEVTYQTSHTKQEAKLGSSPRSTRILSPVSSILVLQKTQKPNSSLSRNCTQTFWVTISTYFPVPSSTNGREIQLPTKFPSPCSNAHIIMPPPHFLIEKNVTIKCHSDIRCT